MRRSLYGALAALTLIGCTATNTPQSSDQASEPPADAPRSDAVSSTPSTSEQEPASETPTLPFADVDIIPGEKFAFVTSDTSRQDLVDVVGEAQLTDEEFHIGEGMMEPATAVNLGDHSFTVIWTDADRTDALEVRDVGSGWDLPAGIHTGMTLDELQQALGEFQIFGLGWDYGGTLMLDNTTLDEYRNDLVLRMQPEESMMEEHPDDFMAVSGDSLYDSTNPHFEPFNMTLDEVVVYLESVQY